MLKILFFFVAFIGILFIIKASNPAAKQKPISTPQETCSANNPVPPTNEVRTITVGGIERTFKVHIPSGYDNTKTPIILNFHGRGWKMDDQEAMSGMTPFADQKKFIVVYPQGLSSYDPAVKANKTGWNAGDYTGGSTDDMAFVKAIIQDVSSRVCVDSKRIYATGLSNGGMMAYRLGCEMSDTIAAIAPVAAVSAVDCNPSAMTRAVPIIDFHYAGDPILPFFGGDTNPYTNKPFRSVGTSLTPFSIKAGCSSENTQVYANGDSKCLAYSSCSVTTELCVVNAVGHTWPDSQFHGTSGDPAGSYSTQDLNANEQMWNVFSKYSLP